MSLKNKNECLLSINQLAVKLSYSRSHVRQRIITKSEFPKPIYLGENKSHPRWKQSDIDQWIANLT